MDTYATITDRVIKSIEAGVIPWQKPWSSKTWPTNAYTHRGYSGCNVFLLGMSSFPSRWWVGYSQAQHMGTCVKRGEKGTQIIRWRPITKKDDNGRDVTVGLAPITLTVFNLSQCDMDWENYESREDFVSLTTAEDILNGYKDRPAIEYGNSMAAYHPVWDKVIMPNRDDFRSPAHFYSTLFHELTHSTGHESRLKRDIRNHFGSYDYSREELVAEMGACFLASEAGIMDQTFNNTVGYIQSWLKALKNDKTLFVRASNAAQKATNYVLGRKND
jgi:antirestriction protein ArdC